MYAQDIASMHAILLNYSFSLTASACTIFYVISYFILSE
jgi:hypothetical protein